MLKASSLPSVQEVIVQHRLNANKKLGQHFLTDALLLQRIVDMSPIEPDTHVIEIGPGPGGLTRALLGSSAASVTAVELDERCYSLLQQLQSYDSRLHIVYGDALTYNMQDLCQAPRAIIANLPYNVGTELIVHWLEAIHKEGKEAVSAITVMLQKEVVDRMAAPSHTKAFGRLSVLCQWLCDVQHCFDVPPEAFSPPPKVMSSVVRLVPRESPLFEATLKEVSHFSAAAFGQRRKMLRGSLKSYHSNPIALLESCDIDPSRRAETLTLEEIGHIIAAAR